MRIRLFIVALGVVGMLSFAAVAQPRSGGAIVAVDEGGGGTVTTPRAAAAKPSKTAVAKPVPAKLSPPKPKPYSGPTIGDKYSFLNFEVIEPVKPIHTNAAKQAGARGLVQVEILVDTDGRVLTAKARTGNKLLWPEAERAALASRLNRPVYNGQSVRAVGFLVYRFGPADDDD